ncbi:DNA-deoxyinosine glycosylase [Thiomicrorhabdus indica]|uniref:DNA-deoxyinosine glycosylase n=1 Tax=Thiomicrorhabdus indica TaxID=2267253 RepID=UPI00102D8DEE|nr:DNA-deoxyinosine glycosylase [Thiomicrorhabdus indica]
MSNLQNSTIQGFRPIIPKQPKILVLGSMPSVKSLEDEFYYAHSRNAFWPIIENLTGRSLKSISEKISALDDLGIFLWDVLQACERKGSLDSAIRNPEANDFEGIFTDYPEIQAVCFNGQAAEKLFRQHVLKHQSLPAGLVYRSLPSTSPANAKLKIEDKYLIWEENLRPFL